MNATQVNNVQVSTAQITEPRTANSRTASPAGPAKLSDQLHLLAGHRKGLVVTVPDGLDLEAMARTARLLEAKAQRLASAMPRNASGHEVTQEEFDHLLEQRDNARSKVKRLKAANRELHRQLNAWFHRQVLELASQEAAERAAANRDAGNPEPNSEANRDATSTDASPGAPADV